MIRRALFWSATWVSLRAWRIAVRASLLAQKYRPETKSTLSNSVPVPRVSVITRGPKEIN